MQARLATAVLLGFVLVAAASCGGSDGLSTAEEEALQERLEAAELEAARAELEAQEAERLRQAEEAAREEAERQAAEAERLRLEEEAARQKAEEEAAEAERLRLEEEAAREEAERLRLEEEAAREEAERLRLEEEAARAEAERLRQEEEAARQAAEAERQRLANEAEERRKADATEAARVAIAGDWDADSADPGTLAVGTIRFGTPVPVTTPIPPFTTSTSRSGSWGITSHTANREPERHTIEIYTDVEAPTREAFRTSPLNTEDVGPSGTTTVIDGTNMVVGWVEIMNASGGDDNHSRIAASGSFPREIGNPVPFSLVDRGPDQTEKDAANTEKARIDALNSDADPNNNEVFDSSNTHYDNYRLPVRNMDRFPQRYAYTTSGTLQGAGGTYRCSGATMAATCTVQNRGGSFEFGGTGDWDFIPSSGTVTIVVEDAHYMWFGWWARQTVRHEDPVHTTDDWDFEAHHGGTNAVTDLSAATGSATYRGPAAGRYAVYEPDTGESGIGSFTASATLQADFDASPNTVSGTITGFSNDPSWSLALKRGNITGGNVAMATDGVTWTIDGIPDDSGAWEAGFYSDLGGGTITYQPHGIAGTFEATYDPSGAGARAALIGGFGAHR